MSIVGAREGLREGAALDLHGGIDTPPLQRLFCGRWAEGAWLVNTSTGEMVRGRCKATNLCAYCARLFAVETSELLLLDALEDAPGIYAVLTARDYLTRSECRRHLTKLRKSLRKRWPHIRWAVIVEFQRAGRLHLNLLVKGVPVSDVDALHEAMTRVWCARVDAVAGAQFVGAVNEAGGLVRYIALHFLKESQAPPVGWRGHRISYTRDYLVRPAAELRAEARRSLRVKRLIWKGLDAEAAELEVLAGEAETWEFRKTNPNTRGLLDVPGSGLTDGERDALLLAAGVRDYGGDEVERLAARVLETLRDDYWNGGSGRESCDTS